VGANELLELQRIDDRIADIRRQVAQTQARLAGSSDLDTARRLLATREEELRDADEAVEVTDRRAAELRARARNLEKQLFGGKVRNPQELLTLDREFAEVRGRLSAEEDEELERMESQEAARTEVAQARGEVEAIEGRRAAEAGPDTDRLAALAERLTDSLAECELVRARRPAAELALYDRLAVRLHPAVVRLGPGDVCLGCRIAVSPREARAVLVGDAIIQCPNCDRVLAR
jgi:predicted  nucleic acid-binding Zn-ribbon protein